MKLFVTTFCLFICNLAMATPADDYQHQKMKILEHRETGSLKNIADRLGLAPEVVEAATERKVTRDLIRRFGHVSGEFGVCEIDLTFELTDSRRIVRCLKGMTVTTFFP